MKRAQDEWKHDKVYDPKGHKDLYISINLLYDFKVTVTFVVGVT